MSLTKADLIDSLHDRLNLPKTRSLQVIDSLLDIIKATLGNGEDVLISRFGKFCVKEKRERPGRNPRTREEVTVKPMRVVTFKCSNRLRDRVNGKR